MAHPNVGIGMPNPNPRPAVQAPPQLPSGVKQEYIDSTLYSDAASKGDISTLQVLVDAGDVNAVLTIWHQTAIHLSCGEGRTECIAWLLSEGAHLEVADKEGWTPIMHAAMHSQLDAMRLLISHGANCSKRDCEGETVSQLARDLTARAMVETENEWAMSGLPVVDRFHWSTQTHSWPDVTTEAQRSVMAVLLTAGRIEKHYDAWCDADDDADSEGEGNKGGEPLQRINASALGGSDVNGGGDSEGGAEGSVGGGTSESVVVAAGGAALEPLPILPVEVWCLILTFLPRHAIGKQEEDVDEAEADY